MNAQPVDRDRPVETIAGFLAAVAIVAALLSLAYRPVRIDPFAIVLALVAAGMGGRHQRLAAIAVATASVCFILGMVIAILAEKPLF
ncbi:MAG: hypothetical protein H0W87_07855 [Actinobacteria bacterium]|nr:hypothetical protein [Actinomycetota bacterium]